MFTGLTFERFSGKISLSRHRIWLIRLALLYTADCKYASGDELMHLLGHFNWGVLLRRELLCLFEATYRFAARAKASRWRLWPVTEFELRAAASLIAFAHQDSKRPVDGRIYASDAAGASTDHHGGFGVCCRTVPPDDVWPHMAAAEKWRYCAEDLLDARATALGMPADDGSFYKRRPRHRASTDFEMIPYSCLVLAFIRTKFTAMHRLGLR